MPLVVALLVPLVRAPRLVPRPTLTGLPRARIAGALTPALVPGFACPDCGYCWFIAPVLCPACARCGLRRG